MMSQQTEVFHYLVLGQGAMAVRICGEFVSLRNRLRRTQIERQIPFQERRDLFADLSGITRFDAEAPDILYFATYQQMISAAVGAVRRHAIYAPVGTSGFGLARMYESFADPHDNIEVQVFTEPDPALVWLGLACCYVDLLRDPRWSEICLEGSA